MVQETRRKINSTQSHLYTTMTAGIHIYTSFQMPLLVAQLYNPIAPRSISPAGLLTALSGRQSITVDSNRGSCHTSQPLSALRVRPSLFHHREFNGLLCTQTRQPVQLLKIRVTKSNTVQDYLPPNNHMCFIYTMPIFES